MRNCHSEVLLSALLSALLSQMGRVCSLEFRPYLKSPDSGLADPLLDDSKEILARREQKEKLTSEHIVQCQHSSVSNLNNETARWGHKFETSTKTILLEAFSLNVIAADENEQIRFACLCNVTADSEGRRVLGIGFKPGLDPAKKASAGQARGIQFLDIRNNTDPYLTIKAHRG
ncbi:hypothetical protein M0R45_028639 [Rubus argutus]|uniref:Uncharacterized protein n=1 Tax=Rubus argutus TaxID=59490 RepID=A0AAW1W7Y3_RUBAR